MSCVVKIAVSSVGTFCACASFTTIFTTQARNTGSGSAGPGRSAERTEPVIEAAEAATAR
jgi:hypothetical protein